MTSGDVYRRLMWLYPVEFRQQFSAEMLSVFEQRAEEQRAGERFASGNPVSFAFLLNEFFSIVKGAYVMWLAKILPIDRKQSRSGATATAAQTLNPEEATKQRDAAIKNMVAALANHDFTNARRYSDEEVRLKHVLEELQAGAATTHRKLA